MRILAAREPDASVASPLVSWAPAPGGLESLHQYLDHRSSPRRSYVRAEGAVAAGGVPDPEPQWNFITMGAQAKPKDDPDEFARTLAADIARAMQHRPLMSRLARIEAAYAELPGGLSSSAATSRVPPPLPSSRGSAYKAAAPAPSSSGASSAPIDQLMEEFGVITDTPPKSAAWLGKAQRERSRARRRNLMGWLATIAVGGVIIAMTASMMPH